MIQAQELRIGNWYLAKATGLTEESFEKFTDWQFAVNYQLDCDPIPISPEILDKCGFKKNKNKQEYRFDEYVYKDLYEFSLGEFNQTGEYIVGGIDEWIGSRFRAIKYLHQLQNLYFALTGEELAINL